MSIQIGDFVRVLDENLEGKVIAIDEKKNLFTILDDKTNLEFAYFKKDLVKMPQNFDSEFENQNFSSPKKDSTPPKNTPSKSKKTKKPAILKVDLHEKEIPENFMPKCKILERQLSFAKVKIENAQKQKLQEMIFVHGIGKGILKEALQKILEGKGIGYAPENLGAMRIFLENL